LTQPAHIAEPGAILATLRSAASVKDAARSLGMKATNLVRHVLDSDNAELSAAYDECSARGAETRGSKRPKPKKWAVIWRTPPTGNGPVQIWTVEAMTGDEAYDIAKSTERENITIVEIVGK
jgi:hypothetical protein